MHLLVLQFLPILIFLNFSSALPAPCKDKTHPPVGLCDCKILWPHIASFISTINFTEAGTAPPDGNFFSTALNSEYSGTFTTWYWPPHDELPVGRQDVVYEWIDIPKNAHKCRMHWTLPNNGDVFITYSNNHAVNVFLESRGIELSYTTPASTGTGTVWSFDQVYDKALLGKVTMQQPGSGLVSDEPFDCASNVTARFEIDRPLGGGQVQFEQYPSFVPNIGRKRGFYISYGCRPCRKGESESENCPAE